MGRSYKKLPAHFKITDLDPILVIPATFAGSQGRVKFVPAWLSGLRLVGCVVAVTNLLEVANWRFKGVPLRPLNVITVLETDAEKGTLVGIDASLSLVKAAIEECVIPLWTGETYHAGNIDAICNWITKAAWGASPVRNCTVVDTDNGPLIVGPPYRTLVTTAEALSSIGLADGAKKALQVVSGTGLDMSSVEAALSSFLWSVMAGTARVWLPDWKTKKGATELEQLFIESRRKMWTWVPGRIVGKPLESALWRKPLQWWHVGKKAMQDEALLNIKRDTWKARRRKAKRAAAHKARLELIVAAGMAEPPPRYQQKWRQSLGRVIKKAEREGRLKGKKWGR